MRIALYQKIVRLNGMHTFDRNFIRAMKDKHQIYYVYEGGEQPLLDRVKNDAYLVQNSNQIIDVDLCIYSSIVHASNRIQAKKYYQILHTDLKHWNVNYKPTNIDKHIAVGQAVADSFKAHNGLDAIVIPNLYTKPVLQKALRLLTASRIAQGKGFDRVVEMAKRLRQSGKPWVWEIYGTGSQTMLGKIKYSLHNVPNINFMGVRYDIENYMTNADYIVQLSDNEGFCYSVVEALQQSKPVIVTRWQGVEDMVKDGENGYILDMDLSNLDIEKLYNRIPKSVNIGVSNSILLWDQLLQETF